MPRIHRITNLAMILATASATLAQQNMDTVKIKSTHVAGNVHMLEGRGGNIGVSVGDDGILIVDDQFALLADKIRAAIGKLGDGKLKFVLNTHWHGDHTGGNPVFGRTATIIAHTNVRKRLINPNAVLGREREPMAKEGLPVITFDDALSIHFNGETIKAFHLPHGHTDGDIAILFTKSNVLHMGDDFFAGAFPFVDLNSGGNAVTLAENVGKLIEKLPRDVKIIPGHGPLSTLDDLKSYHAMLLETIGVVRSRIKAGKTLDQVKAEGLPDKWTEWGAGFISTDRWLEIIYRSLTQKPADQG